MKMRLLSLVCTLALGSSAFAGTIGMWDGSSRTWNNGDFSTVKATAIGAGHTVGADAAITPGNLAGYDVFLMAEPTTTISGAESAALLSFMNSQGGVVLLFTDNTSSTSNLNSILSSLGSGMSFAASSSNLNTGPILGGTFASEGPPYDIVGGSFNVSLGKAVSGGSAVVGNLLRYETFGNGYLFAFGDRFDHDFAAPTAANNNGRLFLNLLGDRAPVVPVPPAAALGLAMLGGLGLVGRIRRRRA